MTRSVFRSRRESGADLRAVHVPRRQRRSLLGRSGHTSLPGPTCAARCEPLRPTCKGQGQGIIEIYMFKTAVALDRPARGSLGRVHGSPRTSFSTAHI